MVFNDKVYKTLKWIAMYLLPATGTLYFALSSIWNLPYGEQIVGTITAVDTFIGVLLGISTANYKGDGTLEIDMQNPDKDVYSLVLNVDPEELTKKKSITFKVGEEKTTENSK